MSAAFVKETEMWPAAGPLALEVLNDDGEHARLYGPGQAEVTLIERGEGGAFVMSLGFHSLEQAKRAGTLLAETFTAVREIQAEPKPTLCAVHRWQVSLFSRDFKHLAICERCGAVADILPRASWTSA